MVVVISVVVVHIFLLLPLNDFFSKSEFDFDPSPTYGPGMDIIYFFLREHLIIDRMVSNMILYYKKKNDLFASINASCFSKPLILTQF